MQTYTWSKNDERFFGMTQAQTDEQFRLAFGELESVCRDLKFEQRGSGGRLRFTVKPRKDIRNGALGYHYGGGRIELGGTQDPSSDIGWPNRNEHTMVVTIQHEIGHFWGWKHVGTDSDCAMNPHLPKDQDLCAGEVLWMQNKWGIPSKKFYPWSYANVGRKIREIQALRAELKTQQPIPPGSGDWEKWKRTHAYIVDLVAKETRLAREWHKHKESWLNVPMAG